jgi:hypothetical protein
MIVSFLREPPQPEDRLRGAIKKFLQSIGLEYSPACVLWVKDEILGMRQMPELVRKVHVTIALAFMETFPYEENGAEGAFMCQHRPKIQAFVDGDLRRVFGDAVLSGEEDKGGE